MRLGVLDPKPVTLARMHGPVQEGICKVKLGLPTLRGQLGQQIIRQVILHWQMHLSFVHPRAAAVQDIATLQSINFTFIQSPSKEEQRRAAFK